MSEEIPTLKPFELEIIEAYKTFSIEARGGKGSPRKGVWIKGHLLEVREDFVNRMWKRWSQFVEIAKDQRAFIESGTYDSFRRYLFQLKTYDLIHLSRSTPSPKSPLPQWSRNYYALVKRNLESKLWENPWAEEPSWRRQYSIGFKPRKGGRKRRGKRLIKQIP